jgi:nitrogen fixation protein FixH
MTGRRVWWYFVAFFGLIASVNAVMATLAIRTHAGVVTEHPYEKGLAYNAVVKAQNKQAALGWTSELYYNNSALHFTLRDKNNHPIMPEKATATITRPTQKGLDFVVELKSEATSISFPAHGLWHVQVDATHAGMHYQQRKRIVVP